MADPTPPRSGAAAIADQLVADRKKRAELERATGTQRAIVVDDLLGRVSYADFDTAATGSWSGVGTTTDVLYGPEVEVTVEVDRVVSLESHIRASCAANAPSGSTANVTVNSSIWVDGVRLTSDIAEGGLGTYAAGSGGIAIGSQNFGVLNARALVTLTAGTHTIQGGFREIARLQTGSGTVMGFNSAAASLFVDVLQRTI